MSMRATVTLEKKASSLLLESIQTLVDENPAKDKKYWFFDNWQVPATKVALEQGVESAIKELDNTMKGWKPVAEGKETQYGMHGREDLSFWYQRVYTK